jgi:hypothetical protein
VVVPRLDSDVAGVSGTLELETNSRYSGSTPEAIRKAKLLILV